MACGRNSPARQRLRKERVNGQVQSAEHFVFGGIIYCSENLKVVFCSYLEIRTNGRHQ